MEIWKEIPDLDCYYSASSLGRIKSNKRIIMRKNGRAQIINEKILTPILNTYGYLKVRLNHIVGVQKNLTVHYLVALTFLGERRHIKFQINHINGVKTDNRIDNLEYCSPKENINHAWSVGLSSNDHSKKKILFGDTIFNSINECEHYTGVNRNTLSKCAEKGYFLDSRYRVRFKGIEFNSLKEASKKIGLNPKTIAKHGQVIKPVKIKVEWTTA